MQLYFQQPVLSATTLFPDFLISHMSLSIVLSIISFVVYRLPLALTGCHYALILYMIVFLLCTTIENKGAPPIPARFAKAMTKVMMGNVMPTPASA